MPSLRIFLPHRCSTKGTYLIGVRVGFSYGIISSLGAMGYGPGVWENCFVVGHPPQTKTVSPLSCSCVSGSTDMQPTRRILAPQKQNAKLHKTYPAIDELLCTHKQYVCVFFELRSLHFSAVSSFGVIHNCYLGQRPTRAPKGGPAEMVLSICFVVLLFCIS